MGRYGLSFIVLLTLSPLQSHAADTDKLAYEARKIIKQFRLRMNSTRSVGFEDAGIPGTIDGCVYLATEIAEEFSTLNGWLVGRTSLNFRNQANQPDEWESSVLKSFEEQKTNGKELEKLEAYTLEEDADGKRFRYMKAIPTDTQCLSCHGSNISPIAARKLDMHYSDDRARGYHQGDIRGAFTLSKDLD